MNNITSTIHQFNSTPIYQIYYSVSNAIKMNYVLTQEVEPDVVLLMHLKNIPSNVSVSMGITYRTSIHTSILTSKYVTLGDVCLCKVHVHNANLYIKYVLRTHAHKCINKLCTIFYMRYNTSNRCSIRYRTYIGKHIIYIINFKGTFFFPPFFQRFFMCTP